jgi:N-acetylglucosamine-6-phosphate deacetylase
MFIADGHHLPVDAFVAMKKAKGIERSILVSDSVGFGGLAPGLYRRADGTDVRLHAEGRLELCGTPYLAGAALSLGACVATAASRGWLSLGEAIVMAAENPGALLGGRGKIAPGARADLISFSWTPGDVRLGIRSVIAAGRTIV